MRQTNKSSWQWHICANKIMISIVIAALISSIGEASDKSETNLSENFTTEDPNIADPNMAENETKDTNKDDDIDKQDKILASSGYTESGKKLTATIGKAEKVEIQFLSEQPQLTEEQIERFEKYIKERPTLPPIQIRKDAVGPSGINETYIKDLQYQSTNLSHEISGVSPFGDWRIFQNSQLGVPATSSTVNEPSLGVNRDYIFYTGNRYAARSSNGGNTFAFVNPLTDMPTFCCDQDVLYEPSRDMFIWYRQGFANNAAGNNIIRLGISDYKAENWYFYNLRPTDLNSQWTNQWFDYPMLAVTNNHLYISTNMFDFSTNCRGENCMTRTVLMEMSLDKLKRHAALTFGYIDWTATKRNFALVQGAKDIMYWGNQKSNDEINIFRTVPGSPNYYLDNVEIDAWQSTRRGEAHCASPDGRNWCNRTDDRLTGAWVGNGIIGFFWNVKEGRGFTYPYVDVAIFRESDRRYLVRPSIYNNNHAYQYGTASPNWQGDIGTGVFFGGGGIYPGHAVGLIDHFSRWWELKTTIIGFRGDTDWGDYIRIRPYIPGSRIWSASGYSRLANSNVLPRYVRFGREKLNPLSIADGLDNNELVWTSGGNAYWFGDRIMDADNFYGKDSAINDKISDNQNTWVQTTVAGSGILKFDWMVSSEKNRDFLEFYIDDNLINRISGDPPIKTQMSYNIGPGVHILKWRYIKDGSITKGLDMGWVDKVEYISAEKRITVNTAAQILPAIYGNSIVWQDNRNGNLDIYMYDLLTNKERRITTNTADQYNPKVYGDSIVWQDGRHGPSEIYMYSISANTERKITTPMTGNDVLPAIYGDRVAYVSNTDIYMYDLSTNAERRITTNMAGWAPAIYEGRIVWQDERNGNWDIYMYDLSTNTERRITTNTADQWTPAIYGNRIVWEDWRNGNSDIYMYDLSTNTERRITTNTGNQGHPVIHGNRIVYEDGRNDSGPNIYMYDLSTNTERRIITTTANQAMSLMPVIYGNRIVWNDNRNGNEDIYMYTIQ